MSTKGLPTAFSYLGDDPNPAVEAALVEAAPYFNGEEASAALDILIQRDAVNSLAELIGLQRSLDPKVQAEFVERTPRMRKALARAIHAPLSTQRVGAIELIEAAGAYEDAYLLPDALRVNCPRTRSSAAEALRHMVFQHIQWRAQTMTNEQHDIMRRNEHQLREVLLLVLRTWANHLQVVALRAVLWMIDDIWEEFCSALDDSRTHVAAATNNILADHTDPLLAGAILRSLTVPRLAQGVARALSETRSPHYLKAILAQGDPLQDQEVLRGLRKVRIEQWQHECFDAFHGLTPMMAAAAVRLIEATGSPKSEKLALYRRIIEDGDATMRAQVVEWLVQDSSEETTALLSLMAPSCEEPLAQKIAAHIRQQPSAGAKVASSAPPDTVDEKTRALHAAFEACWHGFDTANEEQRRVLVGKLQRASGDLGPLLRSALAATAAADRARALRLIRAMRITSSFQDQVFQRARDTDPLVRSLAVALLSDIGGASATRILRSLLNDPDPRVQANAIEALGHMRDEEGLEQAGRKLASPHARVRANAIKALLGIELASAGETLLDMLADDSSAHRLSALWVVERMDIRAVVDEVSRICHQDPDPRLRRRAERVLQSLGVTAAVGSATSTERSPSRLASAEGPR